MLFLGYFFQFVTTEKSCLVDLPNIRTFTTKPFRYQTVTTMKLSSIAC